jgi:AcrR family transcriptional regulator
MKTRDRIVETARDLFNVQGYGAVTTAMLAAHLGIAEGNLWYHFKTRRALLDAIGEQFSKAIEARLTLRPDNDPVVAYVVLLQAMMAEFRGFRFFYRDQQSYGEHTEIVRERAPDWIERTYVQIEAYHCALVDARLLDWPKAQLRDLAINATIILRYGLEHYRELGEPTGEGTGAVRRTLLRHLTLFEHGLTPETATQLRDAIGLIEAAPED